jgi:hypothetical protein
MVLFEFLFSSFSNLKSIQMKNVCIIVISLFFSTFIAAQCVEGNCNNGFGVYKFKDRSVYQGKFVRSKFQGYGKMKYSNGNQYEGEWKNDLKSGKGVMKFTNGDSFTGHFKDDKFWGAGVYRYASGDIYDGNWINGMAHGKGRWFSIYW